MAVVDSWIPSCSLAQDIYNDPQQALGREDAGGSGPLNFTGFVSLGFGGYVTVDLGGCIDDRPGRRRAQVGDRVVVGAGAKLLGPITVGSDARIGAQAVVLCDVPEAAVAVGVPARVVRSPESGVGCCCVAA